MKVQKLIFVLFVFLFVAGFNFYANGQSLLEFNGPFKSWSDVKSRFGAKGDGKTDDTKAIQRAIDGLHNPVKNFRPSANAYMVVYLPAGTYCISSTLVLRGKIGVTIVGEDPANTVIKWIGADADTMFWANGSAYYKISRLTWDANKRKDIEAIGIHWKERWNDANSQSFASLNIEISDNIFTGNCKYGISGGTSPGQGMNANDSEIAIRRCLFNSCTGAGINITGYNALDYWVWDCRFVSCNIGINNAYGNFHAYRSYFKKSAVSDVFHNNGYYTSMRGCYSEDSRAFSLDDGYSTNPFKRIFENNVVVRPTSIPIQYYHWGKIYAVDNKFDKSVDPGVGMFIKTGSWGSGMFQVLSMNNTYRSKQPVSFTATPNKLYSFNDKSSLQAFTSSSAFLQKMDIIPPKIKRATFEVPPRATERVIQEIINDAAKLKGQRPIIHFPVGKYVISKPLVIPEGSDLQIIGDGFLYASIITASAAFPAKQSLLKVFGPSTIVISEIQFGEFDKGHQNFEAIEFNEVDQPGSQAFIDQLYSGGKQSINGSNLDYLYIQMENSFFADGNVITGGNLVQNGKGTAGLYCFGAQFAGLVIDKKAKAVFKDCWWEGGARVPLNISGAGDITVDGSMIAPNNVDSNTTISIGKFSGKFRLLNMYLQGGIKVEPSNSSLELLLWNIHFYHVMNPLKFMDRAATFKGAFLGLTTQCFVPNDKKCELIMMVEDKLKGVDDLKSYMSRMLLEPGSASPRRYVIQSKTATNLCITRVSVGYCNAGFRFSN